MLPLTLRNCACRPKRRLLALPAPGESMLKAALIPALPLTGWCLKAKSHCPTPCPCLCQARLFLAAWHPRPCSSGCLNGSCARKGRAPAGFLSWQRPGATLPPLPGLWRENLKLAFITPFRLGLLPQWATRQSLATGLRPSSCALRVKTSCALSQVRPPISTRRLETDKLTHA